MSLNLQRFPPLTLHPMPSPHGLAEGLYCKHPGVPWSGLPQRHLVGFVCGTEVPSTQLLASGSCVHTPVSPSGDFMGVGWAQNPCWVFI